MPEYYINPRSLVTYEELVDILKLSKRAISKLIKTKNFPKPVKFTGIQPRFNKKRWLYQDIVKFIDNIKNEAYPEYESETEIKRTATWWVEEQRLRRLNKIQEEKGAKKCRVQEKP